MDAPNTVSDKIDTIDFIPLTGSSSMAKVSRRFGEFMHKEAAQSVHADKESPGRMEEAEWTLGSLHLSFPAWRGARWVNEGENEEALDEIAQALISEFPSVAFVLSARQVEPDRKRFVCRAHFRWPGAMGAEESLGLSIQETYRHHDPATPDGQLTGPARDQAELGIILWACFSQVPQAQDFFLAQHVAQEMDQRLPQPPRPGRPGPRI